MHHIGTQTLTTERLILRRLLPADAETMYRNWASDPAVTKFLRWDPHPNAAHTRTLLTEWAQLYANNDYYQWAICEKDTGEVFGNIGLVDSRTNSERSFSWQKRGLDCSDGIWEAGYCIGRAWWNQGYTTEALRAVVRFWFCQVDAAWLTCGHAIQNPASGAVMRKAGFVYDHDAEFHKFDGTPMDCHVYLLRREDFDANA